MKTLKFLILLLTFFSENDDAEIENIDEYNDSAEAYNNVVVSIDNNCFNSVAWLLGKRSEKTQVVRLICNNFQ